MKKDDDALPGWVENIERWRPGQGRRYYANVRDFQWEEDFFPAKVMSGAASWLRKNATAGRPFFLQVESFDVHEPFHTPEPYASLYGNGNMSVIFSPSGPRIRIAASWHVLCRRPGKKNWILFAHISWKINDGRYLVWETLADARST